MKNCFPRGASIFIKYNIKNKTKIELHNDGVTQERLESDTLFQTFLKKVSRLSLLNLRMVDYSKEKHCCIYSFFEKFSI